MMNTTCFLLEHEIRSSSTPAFYQLPFKDAWEEVDLDELSYEDAKERKLAARLWAMASIAEREVLDVDDHAGDSQAKNIPIPSDEVPKPATEVAVRRQTAKRARRTQTGLHR
ncbi:hypothetical protein Drorol1_Dr00020226 [Drosera rotundifolia]